MVRLGEVNPIVWDGVVDEMETMLKAFDFDGADIEFNWRTTAAQRKLERELFQKYGFFKEIILDPRFQQLKQFGEEHINFDFQVGEPIMPISTIVIVLFMMYKRVNNAILALSASFFLNINPFYVVLGVLAWYFWFESKKPKQFVGKKTSKSSHATSPEPLHFKSYSSDDTAYDHILIGSDIATLYTAALLSRVGHRCCVLQPRGSCPVEVLFDKAPCPVPLQNLSVGKVDKYQALLDIGQQSPQNQVGRATFFPIGSASNGFSSSFIRIVRNGQDKKHSKPSPPLIVRAGEGSFAADLTMSLGIEKQELSIFFAKLTENFAHITSFLIARVMPGNQWQKLVAVESTKKLMEVAAVTVEDILGSQVNEDARGGLGALGVIGSEEALRTCRSSALAVGAGLHASEHGTFYPVGGPLALHKSLIETIRRRGGEIYFDVPVDQIEIEERDGRSTAVGVRVTKAVDDCVVIPTSGSVVSGQGILGTYLNLLDQKYVSVATRSALSNITEARPKIRVVYWLTCAPDFLSNCDYIELGSNVQSSDPADDEQFAAAYCRVWSPSAKDPTWSERHGNSMQTLIVELEATEPLVTAKVHEFSASAFDSSDDFPNVNMQGPRVFSFPRSKQSTAASDDSNDWRAAHSLKVESEFESKAKSRADKHLSHLYPLAKDFVVDCRVALEKKKYVSNRPEKYLSPLNSSTDIAGLFLCGRDVSTMGFSGDIQGGWVAANAVLGYTAAEMVAGRNVASDLANVAD